MFKEMFTEALTEGVKIAPKYKKIIANNPKAKYTATNYKAMENQRAMYADEIRKSINKYHFTLDRQNDEVEAEKHLDKAKKTFEKYKSIVAKLTNNEDEFESNVGGQSITAPHTPSSQAMSMLKKLGLYNLD